MFKWGLLPRWLKDPKSRPHPINLQAERVAFTFGLERRCLILADGFYEWAGTVLTKRPYRFTMKSGEPFAFAGIWEQWGEGRKRVRSCAVLTTDPNGLVRAYHDRMPVILPREAYEEWLAPETPVERLTSLLVPYPADEMQVAPANKRVGNPKYDYPDCLKVA